MKNNNIDRFVGVYEKALTQMVQKYPNEYGYSVSDVPGVVKKMKIGFENGTYNRDGRAIKLTCKMLRIPYTYSGINGYFVDGELTEGSLPIVTKGFYQPQICPACGSELDDHGDCTADCQSFSDSEDGPGDIHLTEDFGKDDKPNFDKSKFNKKDQKPNIGNSNTTQSSGKKESEASTTAKKQGLTSAGFGRWADKTGKVIATTQSGKLIPVKPEHEKQALSSEKPEDHKWDKDAIPAQQAATSSVPAGTDQSNTPAKNPAALGPSDYNDALDIKDNQVTSDNQTNAPIKNKGILPKTMDKLKKLFQNPKVKQLDHNKKISLIKRVIDDYLDYRDDERYRRGELAQLPKIDK